MNCQQVKCVVDMGDWEHSKLLEQKLWEGLCYLVVEYLFVCVNCQQVKCVVETRDWEHSKLLEQKLREKYAQVSWGPLHDGNFDVE